MHTLFLVCAVAGGTTLVIQVLLLMVGFDSGSDADVAVAGDVGDVGDVGGDLGGDAGDVGAAADADAGGDAHGYHTDSGEGASAQQAAASFKFLSLKTIVAFFTFFGLTGLLCERSALGGGASLTLASAAGLCAFYAVGYVWKMLYRLESSGNFDIRNAVGVSGRTYLKIPPRDAGRGKVTLSVQGRLVELNAVSESDAEIPTGKPVRVVGVVSSDTVAVVTDDSRR